MIGAFGLLCVIGLPCFLAISVLRTPAALYGCAAVMAMLLALGLPAIITSLSESLPPQMRSGGIGIVYAVAVATFGGTASFVVAWLIEVTGSPLAPAWYMSGALVLGLCAVLAVRESAPIKTGVK